MPDTPGQVCYEAFAAAYPADRFVRLTWDEQAPAVQRAWEAAAQAVLSEVHAACPCFRYALGAVVRLAGSRERWRVRGRRWIDREVLPPYAEYHVQSPDDLLCWETEADLDPWVDVLP